MATKAKATKGQRWNRLVLTGKSESRKGKTYVECKCDCGAINWHVFTSIRNGKIKSCARQATPDAKRRDDTIRATRFMLSVDVQNDCVLWNSDGGNCMIRGRRWKNFAQSVNGFGAANDLAEFHHYK